MFQALLLIIPFGLAGAVSPMLLTEQTVLLAGRDGRRAARRFAAGVFLVALAYIGLLVFFGRAISLPGEPSLDSTLDLLLGALLLLISLAIHRGRNRRPQEPAVETSRRSFGAGQAFGFGAFSMATNFTTLAILVPGSKMIAAAGLVFPERVLLVLVLASMVTTPAWLPLALARVAPGAAERGLTGLGNLIQSHGRRLTVLLLAGLGLFLVLRGLFDLLPL